MKRAELKVVDRERTIPTPVKKKENPFSIDEGWRSGQKAHFFAQNTARYMELHEKSRIPLDRLFQGDVGHRLQAELWNPLDMRPQHAADDDCTRALDFEPIGGDHIGNGGQSSGQKNHEKRQNKPA